MTVDDAATLLAGRPEVIAHAPDGGTEHVAEARSRSGAWIAALSPAVAGPPAAWLASAAAAPAADPAAVALAQVLLGRLPAEPAGPLRRRVPRRRTGGALAASSCQTGSAQ